MQIIVTTLQNVATAINQLVALAQTIRATTIQFLNNSPGAFLTPTSYWNSLTETILTDAASVVVDMSTGVNFVLTATTSVGVTRALANPTNPKVGQLGYIRYVQSSGGSNALTFGTQYVAAGGVASLSISSGAHDVDVLRYRVMAGPLVLLDVDTTVSH